MNPAKSKITKVYSADDIRDMALAFQKSRVLLTAYELGLFSALGAKSKTASEVARIIKTPAHSVQRLMQTLCALGFLGKKKDQFSNTPAALRFLVKDSPEFMAGLRHTAHMWDSWSTLTAAVRKGTSVIGRNVNVSQRDKGWLEAFIAAMHERAVKQASQVTALLDLSLVSRILDVGAGSGAYAMAWVKAKKEIKATVFDLPNVVAITRRYIKSAGLLDKIKIVSGDYQVDNLG